MYFEEMQLFSFLLLSLIVFSPTRRAEEKGTSDIAEDGFCEGDTCMQQTEHATKPGEHRHDRNRLHRHEAKQVLFFFATLTCNQGNGICLSGFVTERYIVYHPMGTTLHCAPPTCVAHNRVALCTMVHKGVLYSREVGVTPDIFNFLMDHKAHATKKNGHILSVFGGAQERTDAINPLIHSHSKIS